MTRSKCPRCDSSSVTVSRSLACEDCSYVGSIVNPDYSTMRSAPPKPALDTMREALVRAQDDGAADDVRSALADELSGRGITNHRIGGRYWSSVDIEVELRDEIVAALRSPVPDATVSDEALIEVWNGNRKVTVYKNEVLCIWGPDIEHEMSSGQQSIETVQSAFNWLFGAES